jgi:hypothetical protein
VDRLLAGISRAAAPAVEPPSPPDAESPGPYVFGCLAILICTLALIWVVGPLFLAVHKVILATFD